MTNERDKSPKKGDHYRALAKVPISGMTIFAAPYTGGFQGSLEEGETLLVDRVYSSGSVDLVAASPELRKRIEEDFVFPVPDEYTHFVVVMPEAELQKQFALVEPV